MFVHNVPAGFSAIHTANVLGNRIEFTVRADVDGHAVAATATAQGVSLRVRECQFKAIAEFQSPRNLRLGVHDPARWHIGYVQNLMDGGIVYRYGGNAINGLIATAATISPHIMPCKDAGGASTWYDPNVSLSRKRFGVTEEFLLELPDNLPHNHPARVDNLTRHVEMGDAPGTGNLPLILPCRQVDPGARAVMNQNYRLGWHDPLDANPLEHQRPRLTAITGNLRFKTWLVMSSEFDLTQLNVTDRFIYLYFWEWVVNYATTINGNLAVATGQAALLGHGPCDVFGDALLTGNDANDSVCVKFM